MGRFVTLPAELRLLIYDYAMHESYSLPGQAFVQTRYRVLLSLLRTCRLIRSEVRAELDKLVQHYLEVSSFRFKSLSHLTQIATMTPASHRHWVTRLHIDHFWIANRMNTHDRWPFAAADLASLNAFPNLRYLRLSAGSINGLPGRRKQLWMSTPQDARQQIYRRLMQYLLGRFPLLPAGFLLEVQAELFADQPAWMAQWRMPRGTVFVLLTYECIDSGIWTQKATEEQDVMW